MLDDPYRNQAGVNRHAEIRVGIAHEDAVFAPPPTVVRDQGRESPPSALTQILAEPFIFEVPVVVVFDFEHREGHDGPAGGANRSAHDTLLQAANAASADASSVSSAEIRPPSLSRSLDASSAFAAAVRMARSSCFRSLSQCSI